MSRSKNLNSEAPIVTYIGASKLRSPLSPRSFPGRVSGFNQNHLSWQLYLKLKCKLEQSSLGKSNWLVLADILSTMHRKGASRDLRGFLPDNPVLLSMVDPFSASSLYSGLFYQKGDFDYLYSAEEHMGEMSYNFDRAICKFFSYHYIRRSSPYSTLQRALYGATFGIRNYPSGLSPSGTLVFFDSSFECIQASFKKEFGSCEGLYLDYFELPLTGLNFQVQEVSVKCWFLALPRLFVLLNPPRFISEINGDVSFIASSPEEKELSKRYVDLVGAVVVSKSVQEKVLAPLKSLCKESSLLSSETTADTVHAHQLASSIAKSAYSYVKDVLGFDERSAIKDINSLSQRLARAQAILQLITTMKAETSFIGAIVRDLQVLFNSKEFDDVVVIPPSSIARFVSEVVDIDCLFGVRVKINLQAAEQSVYLGDMLILISSPKYDLRIFNLDNAKGGLAHPHCTFGSSPCWGDFDPVEHLLLRGKVAEFFIYVKLFLQTWNPRDSWGTTGIKLWDTDRRLQIRRDQIDTELSIKDDTDKLAEQIFTASATSGVLTVDPSNNEAEESEVSYDYSDIVLIDEEGTDE